MQVEQEEKPEPTRRSLNNRSQPSMMSAIRTDDEEYHDNTMLDAGIPLAGPALILPSTQDIDGRTLTGLVEKTMTMIWIKKMTMTRKRAAH
jgi:hypothetical protein